MFLACYEDNNFLDRTVIRDKTWASQAITAHFHIQLKFKSSPLTGKKHGNHFLGQKEVTSCWLSTSRRHHECCCLLKDPEKTASGDKNKLWECSHTVSLSKDNAHPHHHTGVITDLQVGSFSPSIGQISGRWRPLIEQLSLVNDVERTFWKEFWQQWQLTKHGNDMVREPAGDFHDIKIKNFSRFTKYIQILCDYVKK